MLYIRYNLLKRRYMGKKSCRNYQYVYIHASDKTQNQNLGLLLMFLHKLTIGPNKKHRFHTQTRRKPNESMGSWHLCTWYCRLRNHKIPIHAQGLATCLNSRTYFTKYYLLTVSILIFKIKLTPNLDPIFNGTQEASLGDTNKWKLS